MKKALVVLLALTCMGAMAFADAPTAGSFHAWNQGNMFPYYQIGSTAASAGWGPQWDNVKGIDQEWTFSYDGNNYGFDATLEFGMDNFGNTGNPATVAPSISWFSTYYKFGDLVKVRIGKPRFNDYTLFSQLEGNNVASRFGDSDFMGILQLFPVSGLSLAAAYYLPQGAAAANAAAGTNPDYGTNIGVAASYAVPDLLTVVAAYKSREATMGTTSSALKQVSGGVSVSAIKGLPISASVVADISNSSNTIIKGFASVGSTMFAPLSLTLDAFFANFQSPSQTAYGAELNAEYTVMAPWAVGVNVGYDGGSATNLYYGWFNQGVGDWGGFEIYPYVKANFDNGSSLKIGVVYATAAGTAVANTTSSNAVIAVPIIYVWSF